MYVVEGKGHNKILCMRIQNKSCSVLEDKPQEGRGWQFWSKRWGSPEPILDQHIPELVFRQKDVLCEDCVWTWEQMTHLRLCVPACFKGGALCTLIALGPSGGSPLPTLQAPHMPKG